jgi:hypothetical protein
MMNKYDEAIEFLKSVEPGSYFDECAELMEGLLANAHELSAQALEVKESALQRAQTFGAESWYKRNSQRLS